MGTIRVVFIQLLFGFSESISHKRHYALLAEIIRKHGVAALREETGQPPGDSACRAAWRGAGPNKGIFFSSWVLVSECFQRENLPLLYAEENSNFWVSYF